VHITAPTLLPLRLLFVQHVEKQTIRFRPSPAVRGILEHKAKRYRAPLKPVDSEFESPWFWPPSEKTMRCKCGDRLLYFVTLETARFLSRQF
jgi:hypothetical protein